MNSRLKPPSMFTDIWMSEDSSSAPKHPENRNEQAINMAMNLSRMRINAERDR